jgi:NADP-reducing hydrogenase subunit HndD
MPVNIIVNGVSAKVQEGSTILEAVKSLGIDIPTLCHHPALSGFGACRLCVVKVEGAKNLPASCVTEVREGMVIETDSEEVIEARKTILELILANHPLDCLTCQKSGDCKLQDYAYKYGVKEIGFKGETYNYPIDDDNPYIVRDNNKCILCGRCVRACAEIKGENILGFVDRGFNTRIAPAFDKEFKYSDCVYCHNCVAVCPVGALMDKEIMGKGRNWEFVKETVPCELCENACLFDLIKKEGKVIGVSARAGKPERFGQPCLQGRLAVNLKYNPDAANKPLIKKDGEFVPVSWPEALGLEDILKKIRELEE